MTKFLKHDASGGFTEAEAAQTGGGGNANTLAALDASGRLDATMMPTGVGAETVIIQASGNLAAGDLVNIYESAGAARVRKADGSASATYANGFVLDAVTSGSDATVYLGGILSGLTGLTVGKTFLDTTPGLPTAVPPTATGNIVQCIGFAVDATSITIDFKSPIVLA